MGERLGRFAVEVEKTITARELVRWSVFFKMEAEAHEKARRKAEMESKRRR